MKTFQEFTFDETVETDADDRLVAAAAEAANRAYAPYSRFHVGAAVRTKAGGVYSGCNVENVSYPVGTCAERNAIAAAVNAEGAAMEIAALALVVRNFDEDAPCSPCGACRQAIGELGPDSEVLYRGPDLKFRRKPIAELLPEAFSFAPSEQN